MIDLIFEQYPEENFLKADGFVLTGFAQPNWNNRIMIKPTMSIWTKGFNVNLPSYFGVLSPNLSATYACANSCTVNAINTAGIIKTVDKILSCKLLIPSIIDV